MIRNMKKEKREKLEAKGWKPTSVAEFLGLTPDEEKMVELRLALSRGIRERRRASRLTQEKFARAVGSSQSRVAKMEAGDPAVSLDLLIRSLFKAGADVKDVSGIIAGRSSKVG
jgi:DNA-binding XRE family transcriptional regulator